MKEEQIVDNLRALQLAELDILKNVLALFEKHGITYFALGGTMLGAVRHKGFIPWDDDIDIGVPREDYERLEKIAKQLPAHMEYQCFDDNPDYPYYFARFVDRRITVRSVRAETDELTPAWIDIFPLDGMPNSGLRRKLHGLNILAARMMFQISRFESIVNTKRSNRPASEKAIIWCVKTFRLQKLIQKDKAFRMLDRTLKRCPYGPSDYNLNAMGAYKLREMFHKEVFGEGSLYPFEDIEIRGPQDYEAYLTQLYGDWRTPADLTHHEVTEITVNEDGNSQGGQA